MFKSAILIIGSILTYNIISIILDIILKTLTAGAIIFILTDTNNTLYDQFNKLAIEGVKDIPRSFKNVFVSTIQKFLK